VSPALLIVALVCGAGLLALWVDVRFPGVHPRTLVHRTLSAAGAAVVLRAIPFPADAPRIQLLVLIGMILPALVWVLVSAIGLLRYLQTAMLRG